MKRNTCLISKPLLHVRISMHTPGIWKAQGQNTATQNKTAGFVCWEAAADLALNVVMVTPQQGVCSNL